jgi:macrolide-specific efflux system membrane fusion protein
LPQNRLEIKPPIAGRAEEVLVNEGELVKAGQIIAWMSSTDRAALLDAARAQGPA